MYKPILNDDGTPTMYEVDTKSNIRHRITKTPIKLNTLKNTGKLRLMASLYFNGAHVNAQIRRWCLIAHNPVDNYKNLEVDHKDGDPSNNDIFNLEWVTREENMNRAAKLGLLPYGENHHNSKYSDRLIHNICIDICNGLSRQSLIKKYNVNYQLIDDIKSGRSHIRISNQYISKGFKYNKYDKESKDNLYRKICEQLERGDNMTKIAKECGVNFSYVSDIKHRRKGLYISKDYTF